MKKTTRILGILLIAAMLLGALAMTASAASTPDTIYIDLANVSMPESETWEARYKNEDDQWLDINGNEANEPHGFELQPVAGEDTIYSAEVPANAFLMYFSFDALGQYSSDWLTIPTDGKNLFYMSGSKTSGRYDGYWRRYIPYDASAFTPVVQKNPTYSGTPVTPQKIDETNYAQFGFTASNWSAYKGYYAITCADELYGWRETLGNAVLINDIVVNTGDMAAAGDAGTPPAYTWPAIDDFNGVLDGRGHSISGLYIVEGSDGTYQYTAFIELLRGEVKNLVISNTFVDASSPYNSVIAADEWLSEGISNVKIDSNVKIKASESFGAFICDTGDITLTNCVSLANIIIDGGRYIGSIAGRAGDEPTFTNCYYTSGPAGVGNNLSSYDAPGMSFVNVNSHTCIAMEHPEVIASCYAKGSTAYTDCMICGKVLSGTKSITEVKHQWAEANCIAPKLCTVCGGAEGERDENNHNLDEKGYCSICNSQMEAKVNGVHYLSADDAFAYAQTADNAVMVLLADVVLNKIEVNGTFTLDLNGFTLKASDSYAYALYIKGGHLTVQDSAGGGAVLENGRGADTVAAVGGDFTIHGGTYGEVYCQSPDSTLIVNGGVIDYLYSNVGTVQLYGGQFASIFGNGRLIWEFLSPDGFFYDAGGNLLDAREENMVDNVTVKQGADLENATVTVDGSFVYNAQAHQPSVTVSVLGKTVDPANYTVSYANNTNAGEATVTVTAKGDVYTGSKTATFTIEKATPTAEHFNITLPDGIYSGEAKELGVELKSPYTGMGAWTMVITKDGSEVTEMKDVGRYIVTLKISGGDNFTALDGLKVADFHIYPDMLSSADVTLSADKVTYSGAEQKPTVTVGALVLGQDYDLVWDTEDFTNAGEKKATITGKGNYDGTVVVTYTIERKLLTADNITLSFTDATYNGNIQRPTFVVMDGDRELVPDVDFKHSWKDLEPIDAGTYFLRIREGSNNYDVGDYIDKVFVIKPAIPTLTLTSPSPSMGPGQTIIMTVVAANPHNAELTDLPTEFKLYYRVGQSGTPVTVSGLTFALPAETALGETVYVWVENVAVSGKYAVGTSNTVEIFVGQVDYSEQIKALDEAIKALEKSHGADVTELEEALAALEEAVSKLDENGYATDAELAAAKAELSGAISDLAEDIAALANVYATIDALNAAKQALQDAINANETDIEAKVANLTKALEDAKTALENAYKAADAALKADLEKQISEAETELTAAIEKVKSDLQAELAKAVENLEKTDKDNADALAKAIEDLTKAIEDAKKFATEEDAKLKEAMEKADAALQAAIDQVQANLEKAQKELQDAIDANETDIEAKVVALNEAIEAAKAAAAAGDAALRSELAAAQASLNASISAIAGDLAAAKESLANAIASGDAALADKIAALSNALDNVSAAYKAADRSLKSSLTTMIQEAEATLQSAIDKVAADLAAAQQALNEAIASGDKALDDKIAALNTALEAAIAASSAADEALSSEMKQAVAALEKAIAQVQKNLDEAKAELVAKDDAMQAELEKLNTFVIVVCVIAGTALCGCGVLVYFVFFGKRKLI